MHIFYLHGFASSAKSSKAAFFDARLKERGLALRCPDFNEPDFASLTITRMIEQVGAAISEAGEGRVALIGSSLGGFVAVQAALRWPARIERMVLLAPEVELVAAPPGARWRNCCAATACPTPCGWCATISSGKGPT